MFENLRIKERLTKAFVMVAAITAIGAVVGLAAMLVMSNRYSSALVNYGFSQGDIGKAMITFANMTNRKQSSRITSQPLGM